MENPAISIILGSYNRKKFLKLTIESIRRETQRCGLHCEIIVIDGGSVDGSIKWLTKQKDIIAIIQHNRGIWRGKKIIKRTWGYFINLGFKCAQGKYICMLSDDCLIVPNAIKNGYEHFEKELAKGHKIGAVPFYWRNWPEQTQYAVYRFYGLLNLNHGLYLNQALQDIGYADEKTYQFYAGDIDIIFKMHQKGYLTSTSEDSYIEHHSHANTKIRTTNALSQKNDDDNLVKKWREIYPEFDFSEKNRCTVIEKTFHDQHKTWKKFYNLSHLKKKIKIYLSGKLNQLRNAHRNVS